ncbi:MAG: selenocysteine-specific translation elongation factor [Planctomycetes bacterium]|nr:selenocysteine-specific translation elongation factor [Planctomycetota bacterium]
MSKLQPVPVVIGTAGHIDHGKSALIEALCGTHPDRWQEEKERGITLDLGYAQTAYPDGFEIGFVDVPGHERLVRKMVAGATGMGAAILVIACDDGVMPQTREHFEVLQLLGLKHGLIALSKADLADAETLELAQIDVEELITETSWQDVPILPVSAHSGAGMEELRAALRAMAEAAKADLVQMPHAFRMPVQRSFALHGAGTVATGVCASGSLQEGQNLQVLPSGKSSRVRRVHIHGRDAGVAQPGLRTALSLPDLNAEDCPRGAVVAAPGSLRAGKLLRVALQLLPTVKIPKHASDVQVLAGTAAVEGRIFLPPEVSAEGPILVDLELQHEMALVPGERMLLRRPSPGMNLGAGRFLAFAKHRLRRKDEPERTSLQRLMEAVDEPLEWLVRYLEQPGVGEQDVATIAARLGWDAAATLMLLQQACQNGAVREMSAGRFLGMGQAGQMAREVQGVLAHWRNANPHRTRIPVGRLRERLGKKKFPSLQKMQDHDLEILGLQRQPGLHWHIVGAEPDAAWIHDGRALFEVLKSASLFPPPADELQQSLGLDGVRLSAVMEMLQDQNDVIIVDGSLAFAAAAVEELRDLVVHQLQQGGLDIPAIRDRFGTTRKFLMPLLEHLDERGVTARRGGNRILRDASAPLA